MHAAAAVALGVWAASIPLVSSMEARLLLGAPPAVAALFAWTLAAPARWLGAFLAAALLLPPLPIALGDSGPHPALLVAAMGLFIGLIAPWRLRAEFLAVALAFFFLTLLVSIPFAALHSGVDLAAASLARVFLFGIAVYTFFWTAYGAGGPSLGALFRIAVLAAGFACVDFYFQLPAPAGYGPQFVWLDSGVFRRAQGFFYEASTLGNFCAFFVVFTATALLHGEKITVVSRPALLAGGTIFSAALIFSYSRASVFGLVLAMTALTIINRHRLRFRFWRAGALVVAATLAAGYATLPDLMRHYWLRVATSFTFLFEYSEGVLSGRLESWRAVVQFLVENPWHALFGVGYKTLPYSDVAGRPVIVDNMYLSLLAETGVFGLGALLALHAAILRAAWRAARHPNPEASLAGTCVFCFWLGEIVQLASGDLFTYWRILPVYFFVLGHAVALSRSPVHEPSLS